MLALDADVLWLRTPHMLLREGAVPREFYLVLNGHAEVSGNGRASTIGSGALVGAHAALTATPSPVSARTTQPARVLAFGWAALQRIEHRAADARLPAVAS